MINKSSSSIIMRGLTAAFLGIALAGSGNVQESRAATASSCPSLSMPEFEERLTDVKKYTLPEKYVQAFVGVWEEESGSYSTIDPDGVNVYVGQDKPFLLAYKKDNCLQAVLPMTPKKFLRALNRIGGQIASAEPAISPV